MFKQYTSTDKRVRIFKFHHSSKLLPNIQLPSEYMKTKKTVTFYVIDVRSTLRIYSCLNEKSFEHEEAYTTLHIGNFPQMNEVI